jgi:predicted amidohydrolase
LHQSKSDTEDNIVIDLDLTTLREFRSGWPFFRDRRVDLYSEILKLSSD